MSAPVTNNMTDPHLSPQTASCSSAGALKNRSTSHPESSAEPAMWPWGDEDLDLNWADGIQAIEEFDWDGTTCANAANVEKDDHEEDGLDGVAVTAKIPTDHLEDAENPLMGLQIQGEVPDQRDNSLQQDGNKANDDETVGAFSGMSSPDYKAQDGRNVINTPDSVATPDIRSKGDNAEKGVSTKDASVPTASVLEGSKTLAVGPAEPTDVESSNEDAVQFLDLNPPLANITDPMVSQPNTDPENVDIGDTSTGNVNTEAEPGTAQHPLVTVPSPRSNINSEDLADKVSSEDLSLAMPLDASSNVFVSPQQRSPGSSIGAPESNSESEETKLATRELESNLVEVSIEESVKTLTAPASHEAKDTTEQLEMNSPDDRIEPTVVTPTEEAPEELSPVRSETGESRIADTLDIDVGHLSFVDAGGQDGTNAGPSSAPLPSQVGKSQPIGELKAAKNGHEDQVLLSGSEDAATGAYSNVAPKASLIAADIQASSTQPDPHIGHLSEEARSMNSLPSLQGIISPILPAKQTRASSPIRELSVEHQTEKSTEEVTQQPIDAESLVLETLSDDATMKMNDIEDVADEEVVAGDTNDKSGVSPVHEKREPSLMEEMTEEYLPAKDEIQPKGSEELYESSSELTQPPSTPLAPAPDATSHEIDESETQTAKPAPAEEEDEESELEDEKMESDPFLNENLSDVLSDLSDASSRSESPTAEKLQRNLARPSLSSEVKITWMPNPIAKKMKAQAASPFPEPEPTSPDTPTPAPTKARSSKAVPKRSTSAKTGPKPKTSSAHKRTRSLKPKNPSSNKRNDKDFKPVESDEDDEPAPKKRRKYSRTSTGRTKKMPAKKGIAPGQATGRKRGRPKKNQSPTDGANDAHPEDPDADIEVHEDDIESKEPDSDEQDYYEAQEELENDKREEQENTAPQPQPIAPPKPGRTPKRAPRKSADSSIIDDTTTTGTSRRKTRASDAQLVAQTTTPALAPKQTASESTSESETSAPALAPSQEQEQAAPPPATQTRVLSQSDLIPRWGKRTTRSETRASNANSQANSTDAAVMPAPRKLVVPKKRKFSAGVNAGAREGKSEVGAGAKKGEGKGGKGEAKSPPRKRQTRRASAQMERERERDANIGKRLRSGDLGRKSL